MFSFQGLLNLLKPSIDTLDTQVIKFKRGFFLYCIQNEDENFMDTN